MASPKGLFLLSIKLRQRARRIGTRFEKEKIRVIESTEKIKNRIRFFLRRSKYEETNIKGKKIGVVYNHGKINGREVVFIENILPKYSSRKIRIQEFTEKDVFILKEVLKEKAGKDIAFRGSFAIFVSFLLGREDWKQHEKIKRIIEENYRKNMDFNTFFKEINKLNKKHEKLLGKFIIEV